MNYALFGEERRYRSLTSTDIDPRSSYKFELFNPEVLFHA
jgi:hypothetical protein